MWDLHSIKVQKVLFMNGFTAYQVIATYNHIWCYIVVGKEDNIFWDDDFSVYLGTIGQP